MLVDAGLVSEQPQPAHAMKTKLVYRLIDPTDPVCRHGDDSRARGLTARPADGSEPKPTVRPYAHPSTGHTGTVECPQPDRPSAHSPTEDGSGGDGAPAHGRD